MKKRMLIIFSMVVMFILGTASMAMASNLTDSDFNLTVNYNGKHQISLLDPITVLNDTLGSAVSVSYKNMEVPVTDYSYYYLFVYSDNLNRIVCLTGERLTTSRGITIGSTTNDVTNAYGNPDAIRTINSNQRLMIYYGPNGKKMIFKLSSFNGPEKVNRIQADVFSSAHLLSN